MPKDEKIRRRHWIFAIQKDGAVHCVLYGDGYLTEDIRCVGCLYGVGPCISANSSN